MQLAGWAAALVAARLAQSAERKALNLVVVGSSPTVGVMVSIDVLRLLLSTRSEKTRHHELAARTALQVVPTRSVKHVCVGRLL